MSLSITTLIETGLRLRLFLLNGPLNAVSADRISNLVVQFIC